MLYNIIAIAIGGALGTVARYFLNTYTLFVGYPIGTVLENVFGSLLLGLLTGWFVHRKPKEWIKLGLGVGFCGGFTTMSTLAADTIWLYTTMSLFNSILYLVFSLFGGITLGFIGLIFGMKWSEAKAPKKEGAI